MSAPLRQSRTSKTSKRHKSSATASRLRAGRKSRPSSHHRRKTSAGNLSVRSPSNTSITSRELLGIEISEHSKNFWIERSKANIGVFRVVPYEYNVFDDTDHRILFVMPTIATETLGGGEKPNVYSVLTCMGRDICDIKYSEVKCCNKAVTLEVRVDDEPFGVVQQAKQDFLLLDADTNLLMKSILSSTQGGGLCSRRPKQFTWNVFLASDLTVAIGKVGRNGNRVEDVVLGQPNGFYYLGASVDQSPGVQWVDSTHKLLLIALLVGLMIRIKSEAFLGSSAERSLHTTHHHLYRSCLISNLL